MANVDTTPVEAEPAMDMEEEDLPRRKRIQPETYAPILTLIAILAVWELAVVLFQIRPFILPAPSAIYLSIIKYWDGILVNAWVTLRSTLIGFGFAVIGGVAIGVAIGASRVVYAALYPLLIGFNSIPKVVFVFIFIIWWGIGTLPAVVTAFLISFLPIAVNVATGIATMEPELRDVMRALGASKLDIILKVGLPRSTPYFFASLKIALPTAFVGSIISETVGSNHGIGNLVTVAASRYAFDLVFAGAVVTAIMGVVMYYLANIVERRFTGWATRGGLDGVSQSQG